MATGTTPAAGTSPNRGTSYVITPEQHVLRVTVAILFWIMGLVVIVPTVKFYLDSYHWACFLGVPLWAIGVAATIRWRIVIVAVPEVAAAIITNPYVGVGDDPFANQVVLPTGTWFKFPWEVEQDGLIINLRQVAQELDEDFPCSDGIPIRIKGSFTYRADIDLLPRYIAVDDDVINKAIVNLATGYLSDETSRQKAEDARSMIKDFQKGLVDLFEDPTTGGGIIARGEEQALVARNNWALTVEHIFGIRFNQLQVGDVAYSDAYQLVLEQMARQERIQAAVQKQVDAFVLAHGAVLTAPERQGIVNDILIAFNLAKRDIILVEGSTENFIATVLAGMAGLVRRP